MYEDTTTQMQLDYHQVEDGILCPSVVSDDASKDNKYTSPPFHLLMDLYHNIPTGYLASH